MKLNQLRYFDAICRCGTMTEASRQLHVAQPSLSASIRQLEDEYRINLFHHVGKKLTLTREGEQFLSWTREVLKKVSDLEDAVYDLSHRKNRILLGVPPMIGSFLFPSVFAEFHRVHPEVELVLHEQSSQEICRLLMEEQLELGMTLLDDVDSSAFCAHRVYTTQLCCCVHPNHPLSGRTSISLRELARERVVLLRGRQYHIDRLLARYEQEGILPDIILRSSQLTTLKALVETGEAVSFLFRETIHPGEAIVPIPLEPGLRMEIGTVYKRGHYLYNDVVTLLDFIHRMYGGNGLEE